MTKQPFEFEVAMPALGKHTERLLIEKSGVQKRTMVTHMQLDNKNDV